VVNDRICISGIKVLDCDKCVLMLKYMPKQVRTSCSLFPSTDVLCTPMRICYACVIAILAVAVPVLVFFAVFSNNPNFKPEPWTCNIKVEYR
jgi:hypothetical protein